MSGLGRSTAEQLARALEGKRPTDDVLRYGQFKVAIEPDPDEPFTLPIKPIEQFLGHTQRYRIRLSADTYVRLALEIYPPDNDEKWRLVCFCQACPITTSESTRSPIFRVLLDEEPDAEGLVQLHPLVVFSEGRGETAAEKDLLKSLHEAKKWSLLVLLSRLGYGVDADTGCVTQFAAFDTTTGEFENVLPEVFLHDFLAIALMKGHLMGNHGYRLPALPNYGQDGLMRGMLASGIDTDVLVTARPKAATGAKNSGKRAIPASVKQLVRSRDKDRCVACGARSAGQTPDVRMAYDHVTPFSHERMDASVERIQRMCFWCNSGKSDRFRDALYEYDREDVLSSCPSIRAVADELRAIKGVAEECTRDFLMYWSGKHLLARLEHRDARNLLILEPICSTNTSPYDPDLQGVHCLEINDESVAESIEAVGANLKRFRK